MRVASEAATPIVLLPRSSPSQGVPGGHEAASSDRGTTDTWQAIGLAARAVKAEAGRGKREVGYEADRDRRRLRAAPGRDCGL